ncbi:hypothetical protein LINPERHAP1_LOCUS34808 [Linum perenne]
MEPEVDNLPFKVGQLVETKSFLKGFRGAWFRCKIRRKLKKPGGMGYYFEYHDFPDEKVEWMKIYQKAPITGNMDLMVRPCFPPIYRESSLPDLDTILDVSVVVTETWKVGDLVDWWCNDCYWSGRLSKVFGHGKFKIDLLQHPNGEGASYDALGIDLRPTLNWSLVDGWVVPVPKGSRNARPCARLIKPVIPATVHAVHDGQDGILKTPGASLDGRVHAATLIQTTEKASVDSRDPLASDVSDTSSLPLERSEHQAEAGQAHENGVSKRMKIDGAFSVDTSGTNMVEAAILDLEELVNQVNWIKSILVVGAPLTDPVQPSWQFLEHRAPSKPK